MKKAVFLFVVLYMALTAGCRTRQPTPSETPAVTPSPQPTATLPPGIREEARFFEDLDGDGTDDSIIVYIVQEYEDFFDGIFVGVLDASVYNEILVDEGSFKGAYFTYVPNGDFCVLISCDNAVNNQGGTTLCTFNGLLPELKGWTAGVVVQMDGVNLTLQDWTDFIGSWYYTRDYKLTDGFSLEPVSEYMIIMEDMEPLHTFHELPTVMLVEGAYVAYTIPADALVYPISDDGEGHMTFRLKDGRTGRITYTQDDDYGYALIDGVNVDEYFDNIEYWG